ncbi:hypothetical protein [uncultured Helicobacter sp.]|uniref:hypothetical protein n=1 Tax=uncultured Helicobacter sp. TaxID=175537 RepID=UPI0026234802|nr:hypothetical protein [uncultured Helicobacter sp.]
MIRFQPRRQPSEKTKKQYIYIYDVGIFLVAFCAFFPFFATLWIRRVFGRSVEITQILFHLRFPVGAEQDDEPIDDGLESNT